MLLTDETGQQAYAAVERLHARLWQTDVHAQRAGHGQRRHRLVPGLGRRPGRAPAGRGRRALLGQESRQEPVLRLQPQRRSHLHAGGARRDGRAQRPAARGGEPDPRGGRQGHLRDRALPVGVAAGRGHRAGDGPGRGDGRAGAAGRPAARPGQDRHPRPDPAEAGQARPRRAEDDARARRARIPPAGRASACRRSTAGSATTTSGGTAPATRWAWPARTSRSARGSSWSPTPTTR